MPVNYNLPKENMLYQREQYRKSFLTRFFWDLRDEAVLSNINTEENIVDLGCGEGVTLERMVKRFPLKSVLGLDLCYENMLICKAHNLRVIYGDLDNLPFRDGSIDCCLLLEVIEHLSQPESALSEIYRTLRYNGLLFIIFPNDFIYKIARLLTLKLKEAFYDVGHLKQWTPNLMKETLQNQGLVIVKQFSFPFNIWPLAISHLVIARKV